MSSMRTTLKRSPSPHRIATEMILLVFTKALTISRVCVRSMGMMSIWLTSLILSLSPLTAYTLKKKKIVLAT